MELKEAIQTFNNWISPTRLKIAQEKYSSIASTQPGQLRILHDASSGETVAADYLFNLYKPIIAKAFWSYYMGPHRAFWPSKLRSGADKDFASMAYEMLLGGGDPSPYDTFKPSKFSSKADLLKQFGYYFYRYMQNEAFKLLRAEKMGGMTGNIKHTKSPEQDIAVVGYEDHVENEAQTSSPDSYTDDVIQRETLRAFLDFLKSRRMLYFKILYYRLKDLSIDEIAEKLDISGQSVRNHLKVIKDLYKKFVGE